MNTEATPYPLDFDALEKGQTLPAGELERITNEKRGTNDYRFAVLKLTGRIQDELRDRGRPVTVCTKGDDLLILTDAEASIHNEELYKQRLRQLVRTHRRACEVDVANLTEQQKQEHDGRLLVQGRLLQALAAEKKKLQLEAAKRTVPALGQN